MQILVVDDETDVRDLFQQRFRREIRNGELRFNFAFSGGEALGFCGRITPRYLSSSPTLICPA